MFALLSCSSLALAQSRNPNLLTADIRNPFGVTAENHADAQWCAPNHWTPWNGDWACDIWVDNGGADVGYSQTCGKAVYLKVSPGMMPGGMVPDKLRAVADAPGTACASGVYSAGGYAQKFHIYATYKGAEVYLGWVLYAHLANLAYPSGGNIADPMNVQIGTVFSGTQTSACWGSCHVHMEFFNDWNWACWKNVAPGRSGIGAWGTSSVVGKIGGTVGGASAACPACNDEANACSVWDMDLAGCDAHGGQDPNPGNDTQDCAYYLTTNKCRPRGTANCQAGISSACSSSDETAACSTWDNNLSACDLHGISDPNKGNDTQDCAYYTSTNRCAARGTSNCATGCTWCPDCTSCR